MKVRLDTAKRLQNAKLNSIVGFTLGKEKYKVGVICSSESDINPPCIGCVFSNLWDGVADCPTIDGHMVCKTHCSGMDVRFPSHDYSAVKDHIERETIENCLRNKT